MAKTSPLSLWKATWSKSCIQQETTGLMEGERASLSPYNTVKPPNSGHFGDSHNVRSREVVPFSLLSQRLPTKPRPPRATWGCGSLLTADRGPCGQSC